MVMVLEKHLVDEMERIGRERMPCEAAGYLLPFVYRGKQVVELPNRSMTPHDHFEMDIDDLELSIEDFAEEHNDPAIWNQIVLWHTHPGGNLGPSPYDMQNKVGNLRHLVVTLQKEGGALATWY